MAVACQRARVMFRRQTGEPAGRTQKVRRQCRVSKQIVVSCTKGRRESTRVASIAAAMTEVLGRLALPLTILVPVIALFAIVQMTAALSVGATDAVSWGQPALCPAITDHGRAMNRPDASVSATAPVPAALPCGAERSEANAGDT